MHAIRPSICLVDDDPSARGGLRRLLSSAGFEVRAFESGPAFLADAGALDSSCVVTDVVMPGMDGFAMLAELRRLRPSIPVIFVTAHDDKAVMARANAAGIFAFLGKPVDRDALVQAVERATEPRTRKGR